MKNLPRPTDEVGNIFDAGQVYDACVSMVRNAALKVRLESVRTHVANEATRYNQLATASRLYEIAEHQSVGEVTRKEMVKVYTGRMVPVHASGRSIYERILSAPDHRQCPFCGIGIANTLDHFLPKQKFPVYSVVPDNLVPACQWCQSAKDDYFSNEEERQLLHPYYDNLSEDAWLSAEVVEGSPAAFRYFSAPPNHWPEPLNSRLDAHLRELKLPELFALNAGSRLTEIRGRLRRLLAAGGMQSVRAHLIEERDSVAAENKNSWIAAMYRAAATSDWFCAGGFEAN